MTDTRPLPASRQILVLLGILIPVALLGGALVWRDSVDSADTNTRHRSASPVEVAQANLKSLPVELEAFGTLRASRSLLLTTGTSGRVSSVTFRGGQQVAADEPLLLLDDSMQSANRDEANANLRQAELELQRALKLKQTNAGSQQAVDTSRARVAAAQAAHYRNAKQFADRTLSAPFAGTTGLPMVSVGQYIESDTVVTSLDNLQSMTVDFDVSEASYPLVANGQSVQVQTVAYGDTLFTGSITEVDSRIDADSGTFSVRAQLPNEQQKLRVGMWVHVVLNLGDQPALLAPEESIIPRGTRTFVMAVEGEQAREYEVQTGRRLDGMVEIVNGLQPGALLITQGHARLKNGAAVALQGAPDNNSDKNAGTGSTTPATDHTRTGET